MFYTRPLSVGKCKIFHTWVLAWLQKSNSLHMAVLYVGTSCMGIDVTWSCQYCVRDSFMLFYSSFEHCPVFKDLWSKDQHCDYRKLWNITKYVLTCLRIYLRTCLLCWAHPSNISVMFNFMFIPCILITQYLLFTQTNAHIYSMNFILYIQSAKKNVYT